MADDGLFARGAETLDRLRDPVARLARASLVLSLIGLLVLSWQLREVPAMGTDSLIYHLPIPVIWAKTHYLSPLDFPFHAVGSEHAPMLSQTIFYGLIKLTGDTGLVWIVQPLFFLLLLFAFHRSARLLGAGRALTDILTAHLVFFPPFVSNVQIANNDLVLASGAALLLYGLLLSRRRLERGAVVAACGVALLLLTKTVGAIYGALGALLMLPLAWRLVTRRRWGVLAASLLIVVGLGCAFYWRNLALFGNPLHPAQVRLAGLTVFAGTHDLSPLVDHGWSQDEIRRLLWVGGIPPHALTLPYSAVLWLGWGLSLLALTRPGVRRSASRIAVCTVFPLAGFALCFAHIPYWDIPRLFFPVYYALWLGAACGAVMVLRRAPALGPPLRLALVAGYAALLFGGGMFEMTWFAVAAALSLPLGWLLCSDPVRRRWVRLRRLTWLAIGLGLLGVTAAGPWWYPGFRAARSERRARLYPSFYGANGEAWARIDRLSKDRPLTVAYAGTAMILPLYGPRLRNDVVYLRLSEADRLSPVDVSGRPLDTPPAVFHCIQLTAARRNRVDPAYWFGQLDERKVDLLLLAHDADRGGARQELALIRRAPERFRLIYSDEGVYLFAVRPAR